MSISEVALATPIANVSGNLHVPLYGNRNVSLNTVLDDNVINSANFPLFEIDDLYEYKDFPCHPSNSHFNCSKSDFLKFARGPQRLPMGPLLLVTIIFGGIFVTGVVGNVIVCIVIVRNSTMHTATNYYLFSLAVSDLLFLLLGLPYEISLYWHQYPYNLGLPFCKIRALISEASTYVSVLTIVAFSMERFLAICHPLHLYAMSGFKRALRIITALWIISFLSATPFAIFTTIDYVRYPVDNSIIYDSAFCAMLDNPPGVPLCELSTSLFFVIPMILIFVLYVRMGIQIKQRTTEKLGVQQGSMQKESRHQQSRKAVIRMLAAVVITFFVCWAPFHLQRLMYLHAREWVHFQEVHEWLFYVAGWFYYVSCTINPILYNVMSHRYRVAFKDTLCGRRRGSYYQNGFLRDQSSFRETTGPGGGTGYDRVHSIRVKSVRGKSFLTDRESIKSDGSGGGLWRKKTNEFTKPIHKDIIEDKAPPGTNSVVVVDKTINGRPKVYAENCAQETLIKKNETYI